MIVCCGDVMTLKASSSWWHPTRSIKGIVLSLIAPDESDGPSITSPGIGIVFRITGMPRVQANAMSIKQDVAPESSKAIVWRVIEPNWRSTGSVKLVEEESGLLEPWQDWWPRISGCTASTGSGHCRFPIVGGYQPHLHDVVFSGPLLSGKSG